jgi:hypothetical protein
MPDSRSARAGNPDGSCSETRPVARRLRFANGRGLDFRDADFAKDVQVYTASLLDSIDDSTASPESGT